MNWSHSTDDNATMVNVAPFLPIRHRFGRGGYSWMVAHPTRATPENEYGTEFMFRHANCQAFGVNRWLVKSRNLS